MSLEVAIGSTIRQIRKQKGWFAVDLAEQIPMSRSYLSELEHGHRLPSIGLLGDIAHGLNMTVADLWLAIYDNLGDE